MRFASLLLSKINVAYILGAIITVIAVIGPPRQTLGQAAAYTLLELSDAGDGGQVASALNNLGDVAGRVGDFGTAETRATLWKHQSRLPKKLPSLFGNEYSSARGVNDSEAVVGASNTDTSIVPFIWTANGGMERLPTVPGDNGGQAFSVNKHGHVAGYSSGSRGARAFVWTRKTGVRDLGVLSGGTYSRAREINDSSEVVGTSASPEGDRAVLWTKTGDVHNLGTLPGDTSSEATAINNAGAVVGYSRGPQGMRAFLWTKAAGMQDLGVLSGASSSRALDINDVGEVVGTCGTSSGDRAFIWTWQAGMKDLNDAISTSSGVLLLEAHAINNKGQILVMGMDHHNSVVTGGLGSDDARDCAASPQAAFLLTRISAK